MTLFRIIFGIIAGAIIVSVWSSYEKRQNACLHIYKVGSNSAFVNEAERWLEGNIFGLKTDYIGNSDHMDASIREYLGITNGGANVPVMLGVPGIPPVFAIEPLYWAKFEVDPSSVFYSLTDHAVGENHTSFGENNSLIRDRDNTIFSFLFPSESAFISISSRPEYHERMDNLNMEQRYHSVKIAPNVRVGCDNIGFFALSSVNRIVRSP